MLRAVEFVQAVTDARQQALAGRAGLFIGGTRPGGIASRAALACQSAGARVALAYASRDGARSVAMLARECATSIVLPCDPAHPGSLQAAFEALDEAQHKLDFVVHVVDTRDVAALAQGLTQCLLGDFQEAMEAIVHGFVRIAQLAAPRMMHGGSLVAVVDARDLAAGPVSGPLGVVLASLAATVVALDSELAPQRIRVHGILPQREADAPPRNVSGAAFDDAGPLVALLVSAAGSSLPRVFHVAPGARGHEVPTAPAHAAAD